MLANGFASISTTMPVFTHLRCRAMHTERKRDRKTGCCCYTRRTLWKGRMKIEMKISKTSRTRGLCATFPGPVSQPTSSSGNQCTSWHYCFVVWLNKVTRKQKWFFLWTKRARERGLEGCLKGPWRWCTAKAKKGRAAPCQGLLWLWFDRNLCSHSGEDS